ncbi:MAG: FAD-binding oxidoreductase [Phycisphaerales bacterium]|nr:FAD-binding oxidoreductase [Phycisphaerales bacterium]
MDTTTIDPGATASLVTMLAGIVGQDHVMDKDAAAKVHTGDMSWLTISAAAAGTPLSRPDALVFPGTTEEVSEILVLANRAGVPVTPFGGGSGVQGAANADRGGIVMSLKRLNRVRSVDRDSMTAVVEAGHVIRELEASFNADGLSFTHYPASAEWATLGGCIAARGSGVLSTKYGKIEEHVLSLEVVLPTGEIMHTPAVPRHAAGPELTQMFVGSEGALGIVTAATIALRKVPTKRVFRCLLFDDLDQGLAAGRDIMVNGLRPPVMRLYDHSAATGSLERAVECGIDRAAMVLMFDGDVDSVVEAEAAAGIDFCLSHGGVDHGSEAGEIWWKRRYDFYYPPHAPVLPQIWATMDVVADFTHIRGVYDAVTEAMKTAIDPKWNMTLKTHFSHWYPWGSMIYPRFGVPKGPDDLQEAVALHDAIVRAATEAALESGAVINDHHGVGMRLGDYMSDQLGEGGMVMLRGVKSGLDPNNILCPGKLGLG